MDEQIDNYSLSIPSEQIFPDSLLDFFQPTTNEIQSGSIEDTFDGLENITNNFLGEVDINIGDDVDIDINLTGGDRDPITGEVDGENSGSLDGESDEVVEVNYTTANSSATAGSNYQRTKSTLTSQPDETQKAIETPIFGDKIVENNENSTVNLSQTQNTQIENSKRIAAIKDNNLAKISISNTQITEGNKGQKQARFTVTMDSEIDENVKVNFTTVNDTAKAGLDYKRTKGTLNFRPGQTKKIISVPILGDTLIENNEKFQVVLSKPKNANIDDNKGIATIKNNDFAKISIGNTQITEGNEGQKQARFTVTMDSEIDENVKVNFTTVNDTAKAGLDYKRTKGTLNFRPGQTKRLFQFPY
ncbi:Calx-beta domain-containing protein [Okeania sp. KiyG1]|uniref:Calx-beta domain-containing protein n=1 Tax=Okeania sp. KiyG1 TaxID=2720165 RepID=UPI0019210A0F|nr:Calx-beta domain-containing protein [Okeania sp. KiyG1]GGA48279.1 hypothetical protein CYANOKiyG1_67400 [Okeania sp. KiyG1]